MNMWRLIVVVAFIAVFLYYATLVLHLSGVIKIGDSLGFRAKHLLPFALWFE